MPPVELHWRIHWYERDFSEGVLSRSHPDPQRGRRAALRDELVMLLLFVARDGFVGLKYPSDIAAWRDRYAGELEIAPLDPGLKEYPELHETLLSAAVMTEKTCGLPADDLRSPRWPRTVRGRTATRVANWTATGSQEQIAADISLIDLLLSPPGQQLAFIRRHLAVTHAYGLAPRTEVRPGLGAVIAHDIAGLVKLFLRYAGTLRRARAGA